MWGGNAHLIANIMAHTTVGHTYDLIQPATLTLHVVLHIFHGEEINGSCIENQLVSTTGAPKAQGKCARSPLGLDHCGMSTDRPMYHNLDLCRVSYSGTGSVNDLGLVVMGKD